MYPSSLRIDERYAVELMKTSAIADRKPFHDMYPPDSSRCNAQGQRIVVIINGKEYSREELLNATSGMYALVEIQSAGRLRLQLAF